jgi:nicotinamidase-related amidase
VTHILRPIARFLEVARERKVRVMYTQYTNLPDCATFTDVRVRDNYEVLSDPARKWTLESSLRGTWGCETVKELAGRPGEIVIDKYRVDAFIGTPLEYLLRLHGIRAIIHTGIATEVGILPTAWHALNLGFFVVVPEDLVGPMQPEHHDAAMVVLRRLTLVTRASEITRAWGSSTGRALLSSPNPWSGWVWCWPWPRHRSQRADRRGTSRVHPAVPGEHDARIAAFLCSRSPR